MKLFRRILVPLLCLPLFAACVTEDFPANTRTGNFEAMWKILDEHYCFFDYKNKEYGLDWGEVHDRYAGMLSPSMTHSQLFDVLARMSYELRDGHVNLYASHDVARYGRWFDDYPANYSDSLERIYLGRAEDYMLAGGLKYRILDDNVAYVRCATFEADFGDGSLHELVRQLGLCDGLILDVRSNGGGMLTAARSLASLFVNEETVVGYMCHKSGPGHDDFSTPQAVRVSPAKGLRWQKPVAVLVNRRTYSAANSFVSYLKGRPGVTIVGDRTGGGSGMPFTSELPNGWILRFSACPMFDSQMRQTEMGIEPDIKVDISAADVRDGKDTIIETARRLLRSAGKHAMRDG